MAPQYRSEPLPVRTGAEEEGRRFGWLCAGWGAAFLAFLLVVVVPLANYSPTYARNAGAGLSLVAFVLALGFFLTAVIRGFVQYSRVIDPVLKIQRRWSEVLRANGLIERDGLPHIRVLQQTGELNEVAFQVRDGLTPADVEAKRAAMALDWRAGDVQIEQRPGGWFTAKLLPERVAAPVPVAAPVKREPYKLPQPRTWRDYLSALPVGDMVGHTSPDFRTADMAWFMGAHADDVDPAFVLPRAYGMPLTGGHLLVGGKSGSGKSGAINAIVRALLPAVAHGVARMVAIDPKRMELSMNRGYYYKYAAEAEAIHELLGELVELMNERQAAMMKADSRKAEGSREFPLYVIFVDEMMAIMTLDEDPKRAKKTLQRLNLLLTQGRAGGFVLVSATQEVTKENIKNRSLYTSGWALRLDDSNYDMVLGAGARKEYGVTRVKKSMPGAGWLTDEANDGFALVQSYYVTDAMLIADREKWENGQYLGDAAADFPMRSILGGGGDDPGPGGGVPVEVPDLPPWPLGGSPSLAEMREQSSRARTEAFIRASDARAGKDWKQGLYAASSMTNEEQAALSAAMTAAWSAAEKAARPAAGPRADDGQAANVDDGQAVNADPAPEPAATSSAAPTSGVVGDELPPVVAEPVTFKRPATADADPLRWWRVNRDARDRAEADGKTYLGGYPAGAVEPDGEVPASPIRPWSPELEPKPYSMADDYAQATGQRWDS